MISYWIKIDRELILYVVFGAFTFFVNLISYFFFANILGINYLVSNAIAWFLSVLFAEQQITDPVEQNQKTDGESGSDGKKILSHELKDDRGDGGNQDKQITGPCPGFAANKMIPLVFHFDFVFFTVRFVVAQPVMTQQLQ